MSTVILSSQKHFRMRAYEEEDLQAIANFLNTCETIDQYGQFCTVSELQAEFTEPGFEPTQNVRLWLGDTGQIIAFARLWIPQQTEISLEAEGYLGFRVHPQFRDQGLEAEVLGWAETRVTEMAQGRALPARLRATCRDYEQSRLQLFGQFDLHHERSFLRMTRNLTGPLPEARLPKGLL
ncbi:MAG: hypothetical protein HC771_19155 [Synechococcales cyanobacterium CRU_2_2]|nr:hypothetical protein [Synechococcales cyanobacterium CRU_2_2]